MNRILAVMFLVIDSIHLCNNVNEESRIIEQIFSNIFCLMNEPLPSQPFNIQAQSM